MSRFSGSCRETLFGFRFQLITSFRCVDNTAIHMKNDYQYSGAKNTGQYNDRQDNAEQLQTTDIDNNVIEEVPDGAIKLKAQ